MLQHSLLVANDHLGSVQVEQFLQAVIAVDQSPVEIIEITGREVSTLEEDQRPQVGRNHRYCIVDHPLRLVARVEDRPDDPHSANQVRSLLLRPSSVVLLLEFFRQFPEIHPANHLTDRLGAHVGNKSVAILLTSKTELLLAEELSLLERGIPWIDDEIVLVVDHPFEVSRLHVE